MPRQTRRACRLPLPAALTWVLRSCLALDPNAAQATAAQMVALLGPGFRGFWKT